MTDMNTKINVRCRAIILNEGKLLAVNHAPSSTFYALPGGHLEWGENIKECLVREVREELGVVPEIGRLLYVNNYCDVSGNQSIEFFFEVLNSYQYIDCEKRIRSHANEINNIIWLDKNSSVAFRPEILLNDFKADRIISEEVRFIQEK